MTSIRPFCPRPRAVEPKVYPMCLVFLPSSEQWWLGWYLPDLDSAVQIQQLLFEYRVTADPSRHPQLSTQLSRWKQDLACAIYEQLGNSHDASPVWLLMGENAITLHHVVKYWSVADAEFLPKMAELTQKACIDPKLKQALVDYKDYHQWTKQQSHLIKIALPSRVSTTLMSTEQTDSATVVTNASMPSEETPEDEVNEITTKSGRKRGRPKSQPKPCQQAINKVDDPVTPVLQQVPKSAEDNSTSKLNRQALVEAHGLEHSSPIAKKDLKRRRIFAPADQQPLLVKNPTQVDNVCLGVKESTNFQTQELQESDFEPSLVKDATELDKAPNLQEAVAPGTESCSVVVHSQQSVQPSIEPCSPPPEPVLESIPDVNLPGTTVREKLNSCLTALRKENESVVTCHKILAAQQTIQDFFQAVVDSKGVSGPKETNPILHVCGAPGSGKTITVDKCSQLVREAYLNSCDEWKKPPIFCYINCSHLQNRSKQEALAITLQYAETTENNLKRPKNGADGDRSTVIFILDEIDYLVASQSKGTKSEQYIHTLLEWASSSQYMVGVLGISNSVENSKAARLVELGFPRSNKVIFRTYDDKDLTRIALTKIGSTVVDEKAIEFLSKKVAGGSGDARKFLELLSRSIASAMEEMSETVLNALHDKPVVKVPHLMKTFKSSTIKHKELVESAPAHEKHILFVCIHLARTMGSRPLSMSRILWICQQVYDALDLSSVSELKFILERLLDSGLLKVIDKKDDNIRFDTQLEDVESAVEEVLLKQSFYRNTINKLEKLNI